MKRRPPRIVRLAVLWLRRLDRHTPAWVQQLTPWGTSLTLHALVLLALAVAVLVEGKSNTRGGAIEATLGTSQLVDDLTSLAAGERPGDPFTQLDSNEPPSLSTDPTRPDPLISALPAVGPSVALGPEMQLSPRIPTDLSAGIAGPGGGMPLGLATTPFAGRQGPSRARLVRREGGTVSSEKAVERGLDWIARHQRPDGGWGFDTHTLCKGRPCTARETATDDTAATGLAILPMLGAGHSPTEPGRYQRPLELGLAWLMNHQAADGNLYVGGTGGNHAFYSHAIGTMALCEALGVTKDQRYREPARRAVAYTVSVQNSVDGGWRYYPGQGGDTSVMGWELLSLRSAYLAGLEVPETTLKRAAEYLDAAAVDTKGSTYSYMPGGRPSIVMTAEALLVRQYLGWPRNHASLTQGSQLVSRNLASIATSERNIYYWYYAMQFLHNMRGREWQATNPRVRDLIVRQQVISKGCDRGSWDPLNPARDRWGANVGRLYQTSLSLLTLEVYYRYLPLYRDTEIADK
jgi:hypothetical protein